MLISLPVVKRLDFLSQSYRAISHSPRSLPPIPPVTPFRPRHSKASLGQQQEGPSATRTGPASLSQPGLLGRPEEVRVTRRVGEDSLLVVWSPPEDNKDITGYAVKITVSAETTTLAKACISAEIDSFGRIN